MNIITYIKKIFKSENYILNINDLSDLKIQLERKPIQLYVKTISFLHDNKVKINYLNVKNLIKISISIRDIIKKIITSLEESLRATLLNKELKNYDNVEYFDCVYQRKFNEIIKELKL